MFRTENTGSETYLVYEVQKNETIDDLSLGMLTNNKIPGLLSTAFYMRDEERLLRYQISSKITLDSYLAGTISRKKLLTIFKTITQAFLSGEEYMLEPQQFVLNVESIYVNVSNAEAYLICLPLENEGSQFDVRKFFKEILFSSRFETGENGDYLLELSNYLNSDGNFSISGFHQRICKLLQGSEKVSAEAVRTVPPVVTEKTTTQQNPVPVVPITPVEPVSGPKEKKSIFSFGKKEKTEKPAKLEKSKPIPEKKQQQKINVGNKGILIPGMEAPIAVNSIADKPQKVKKTEKQKKEKKEKKPLFSFGKKVPTVEMEVPEVKKNTIVVPALPEGSRPSMPIGETTVLGVAGSGETTVLGASDNSLASSACLVRKRTGEKIHIRGQVFRLGKEPTYVDYCIKDNSAISRSHADIMRKNDNYVLVDNNSLNHTFVDGRQLIPQEQIVLTNGASILLADEEFEFRETGV